MSISKDIKLTSSLQYLKGVGPKKAKILSRKGLLRIIDALYYFPFRYEDRRKVFYPSTLHQVKLGSLVSVQGKVESFRTYYSSRGKKILELFVSDAEGGKLRCLWFHSTASMQESFQSLSQATFTGRLYCKGPHFQLFHPDVDREMKKKSIHWGCIVPIYPSTGAMTQKSLREILALTQKLGLPLLEDALPLYLRERYQFPPLSQAVSELHYPSQLPEEEPSSSLKRLIFEEFFQFQFFLLWEQKNLQKEQSMAISQDYVLPPYTLPFSLSQSQKKAIEEILQDMKSRSPMHRLLQGEVGCGKTVVALLCLLAVIENGYQGALMVPTEALAEQHYRTVQKLFGDREISTYLLTGSTKKKENIYKEIEEGRAQLIVGTHALIQEKISWNCLGMAVIDEQHRFGVRQRSILRAKSHSQGIPHLLSMTATPIPRSLALTYFGELSITSIEEVPPDRIPIKTKVIEGSERHKLYNLLKREVRLGHQSYLVYPLIEESQKEGMHGLLSVEKEFERLQKGPLSELRMAMIHGKTPFVEQRKTMKAFLRGDIDVLLSTTIIEVGIDVANATVMAIENAERFGLSQLHQLRGRVGRGGKQSYCVLVTDVKKSSQAPSSKLKEGGYSFSDLEEIKDRKEVWWRLQVIEKHHNAFLIAEEDLRIRGPGEFLGTQQSGLPYFHFADLRRDRKILENARKEAKLLWEKDPKLQLPQHRSLRQRYQEYFSSREQFLHSG